MHVLEYPCAYVGVPLCMCWKATALQLDFRWCRYLPVCQAACALYTVLHLDCRLLPRMQHPTVPSGPCLVVAGRIAREVLHCILYLFVACIPHQHTARSRGQMTDQRPLQNV